MKILLTNDDGYKAPGLVAAYNAIKNMGEVHVVAPATECSACSHTMTLGRPISVHRKRSKNFPSLHVVHGMPADCVRLGLTELFDHEFDLVVSGMNRGANTGIDIYYSGTIAGAREAAILGITSIALSHAIRDGVDIDWPAASNIAGPIVKELVHEPLPGLGFWSVNFPSPLPNNAAQQIHHVPPDPGNLPMTFRRRTIHPDDSSASSDVNKSSGLSNASESSGSGDGPSHSTFDGITLAEEKGLGTKKEENLGPVVEYENTTPYWTRKSNEHSDYTVIRDGRIAITAIPLFGKF